MTNKTDEQYIKEYNQKTIKETAIRCNSCGWISIFTEAEERVCHNCSKNVIDIGLQPWDPLTIEAKPVKRRMLRLPPEEVQQLSLFTKYEHHHKETLENWICDRQLDAGVSEHESREDAIAATDKFLKLGERLNVERI